MSHFPRALFAFWLSLAPIAASQTAAPKNHELRALLPPSVVSEWPNYGFSHEIAASGEWAAVSNWTASEVSLYKKLGSGWRCLQVIRGTLGSRLGYSMRMQGETLLVGAFQEGFPDNLGPGAVYSYRLEGNRWLETQVIQPDFLGIDTDFGFSVDLDGNSMIASAPRYDGAEVNSGAALIYSRASDASPWELEARISLPINQITPDSRRIGHAVAIEGDMAFVSSINGMGSVISIAKVEGVWEVMQQISNPAPGDPFANHFGAALDFTEDTLLVGESRFGSVGGFYPAGRAHIFRTTEHLGCFSHVITLEPSDGYGSTDFGDDFGTSVALVSRSHALVGSPRAIVDASTTNRQGKIYGFVEDQMSGWQVNEQHQYFTLDNSIAGLGFGLSISSGMVFGGLFAGNLSTQGSRCLLFHLLD